MPKPKKRPKTSKLPPGSGIHKITLPPLNITPTHLVEDVEDISANSIIHASDRILLDQIKSTLENRHGQSYSTSEILRWALWHCSWDI